MGGVKLLLAFGLGVAITLWLAYRSARRESSPASGRQLWPALALGLGLTLATWAGIAGANWLFGGLSGPTGSTAPEPTAGLPELPARLIIPSLGMDESVVNVPLIDGRWNVARLGSAIGRLETTGAHPRDDLAMVLTGHVTLRAIERGPFADLWTLQPLAEVIYRLGSVDYVYAVSGSAEVRPEAVDQLYVPGREALLLLTCTNWDYLAETYRGRLLVRAALVRQELAGTTAN